MNDPAAIEEFLMNEMTLANQELIQGWFDIRSTWLKLLHHLLEGNVPECINHLVNFVAYSGNPKATLSTLQQTLPPTIFDLLIQVYASLEKVRYNITNTLHYHYHYRALGKKMLINCLIYINVYWICSKIPCLIKCSHCDRSRWC